MHHSSMQNEMMLPPEKDRMLMALRLPRLKSAQWREHIRDATQISALRDLTSLTAPAAEEMDDIIVAKLLHAMMPCPRNDLRINFPGEILRETPDKTLHKVMIDAHCIDRVRNKNQYLQHR